MYRQKKDIEEIERLDDARVALLVKNRKLERKLEKRNNRILELEESVRVLMKALGQDEVDSCSHEEEMGMGSSEQTQVEFKRQPHQVDRFRDKYVTLDPLTQERVLNFLGQTKHFRLNPLGQSLFEGSKEDFERALPVLQLLAPSMKHKNWCYLEHEHGDMTTCAGLRAPNQWSVEFTPNEIVFPEIKNHPIMGWEMDMTTGSYSHPWGANFAN
jgi:hypothetical protein